MKIGQVFGFVPVDKANNRCAVCAPINNPIIDSVSFSGNPYLRKTEKNKNVQEAINFGEEIYSKLQNGASRRDIAEIIKQKNPSLNVYSTSKLREIIPDGSDYDAFFQYKMGEEFEITEKSLFLNLDNKSKSSVKNLSFAKDTAHEYLHVMQMERGEMEFLKELSNNNSEYAGFLPAVGDFVFKIFDVDVKNDFVGNTFDFKDKMNALMTGEIIPREKKITPNILLERNKFKNEKEFKKFVNSTFDGVFYQVIDFISKHPENVDEKCVKVLYEVASKEDGIEKLKEDLKKFCANSAKKEKEAYTVESEISRRTMQTESSLNIDALPIFYGMLENALNSNK